ncbi:MAG: DNA topoisomerase IB [Acidobacteria bacterium]|nr:MAG: DNA topoisomerase IB [Acidobacteriota bacterium]
MANKPEQQENGALPVDSPTVARLAGLRYVPDTRPGISRRRAGKGFYYIRPDGTRISDPAELKRIRRLAIPPAWNNVWISPYLNGHLQATGRDARGRKQYRYHEQWRQIRDETKYRRLATFARILPKIRAQVEQDLAEASLSRRKVVAAVVRLLEETLIRVGNEEYARSNRSYGLTTLRDKHVKVKGHAVHFKFRGKSGVEHCVGLRDRRLSRIVRRCQELPGEELFQFVNGNGEPTPISSSDVNEYLREVAGEDYTAKDFRTWAGTLAAALALERHPAPSSMTEAKKNLVAVVKEVAHKLGNTPATCRKFYIHPVIIDAYVDGALPQLMGRVARQVYEESPHGLGRHEMSLVEMLEEQVARLPVSAA